MQTLAQELIARGVTRQLCVPCACEVKSKAEQGGEGAGIGPELSAA
eukprot:COSAG04_NODE_30862_length_260_cov_0.645963_1_plen_45_part_01